MAPGGQARPQPRAEILPSGALPGSKLTTGTAPLGKAFGLGQKAANQPAFICIGGNNPRAVCNAIQPAVATVSAEGKALLQPAVAHAAAQCQASSTASPAAAAAAPAAAPAAGPNAAAAALPATSTAVTTALPAADLTSGSAANQPPILQQGGQTEHVPGTAPEGRDTVYAAADTSTAGGKAHTSVPLLSKATDHRVAAQAATSGSQDGEAAVTAAPDVPRRTQGQFVIQEAMPVLSAASAAPAVVEAAEVSPQKAANSATASAAVVESSAATATPPAYRGEVTPEPAVMQSPVGQQMLLPTSRRKRKGQKAAKVTEPARSNSAWQELVELSGAAEPAAALAGKALSGQCATGFHVQNAVKHTSCK